MTEISVIKHLHNANVSTKENMNTLVFAILFANPMIYKYYI